MFRLARAVVILAYGVGVLVLAAKLPRQDAAPGRSSERLPMASAASAAADAPPPNREALRSESALAAPR